MACGALEEVREHRSRSAQKESLGVTEARMVAAAGAVAQTEAVTEAEGRGVCRAIGYQEICRYLDGRQSLEETIQVVAAATRRYARRQETWLRKVKDAVIMDIQGRTAEEISEEILSLAGSHSRQEERSIP